jgi:hypothetical protein
MTTPQFWLGIAVGIFLGLVVSTCSPARAHSFYSTYCCDDQDCRPVRTDAVRAEKDGWRILLTGELWPYEDTQESPDGAFHWCEWPVGSRKTRCLYAPPMGF